jgi:hypothetical protein
MLQSPTLDSHGGLQRSGKDLIQGELPVIPVDERKFVGSRWADPVWVNENNYTKQLNKEESDENRKPLG